MTLALLLAFAFSFVVRVASEACATGHTPADTSAGFLYWKWEITEIRNPSFFPQASEFRMYASADTSVPISYSGYTLVAVSSAPGDVGNQPFERQDKLFDGLTSTKWCSSQDGGQVPQWLVFKFANSVNPLTYQYFTANDDTVRDPVSWKVYSSKDNVNWILRSSVASASITTGRYAAAGLRTLSFCDQCDAGYTGSSIGGTSGCAVCEAGKFKATIGNGIDCTPCTGASGANPGYASTLGQTACTACPHASNCSPTDAGSCDAGYSVITHISDFRTRATMLASGWETDCALDVGVQHPTNYVEECQSAVSWAGWDSPASTIGTVWRTLSGSGTATLSYGNCNHVDPVTVYLNTVAISSAAAGAMSQEVVFAFTDGALLQIKETAAIIKMNSFVITSSSCSACEAGKYKDAAGNGACTACPSLPAHATCAATSGATCDAGYSGNGTSTCAACEAGKYKADAGNVACTSCAEGYTTTVEACYALDFDGINDYIELSNSNYPIGASHYTIEAYIKPRNNGNRGIIGWGNWGSTGEVNALRLGSDGFVNYWWAADLYATCDLLNGQWRHVAATFDGTNRVIYLDGTEIRRDTPSSPNVAKNDNIRIGSSNLQEYFDGLIDEVRVWKVARSQNEIQSNMNRELKGGEETDLVAYYNFNQGPNQVSSTLLLDNKAMPGVPSGIFRGFAVDPDSLNINAFVDNCDAVFAFPSARISSSVCSVCAAGYSGNSTSACTVCEAGKFKATAGNVECTACTGASGANPGYASIPGQVACTPCDAQAVSCSPTSPGTCNAGYSSIAHTSDFSNRATMIASGWTTDCELDGIGKSAVNTVCLADASWAGWKANNGVGTVSRILSGSGTATLNYGNCWYQDTVVVYLNGAVISSAAANTMSKEIVFDFTNGAVLVIKETPDAVIKMNSFVITSSLAITSNPCSQCDPGYERIDNDCVLPACTTQHMKNPACLCRRHGNLPCPWRRRCNVVAIPNRACAGRNELNAKLNPSFVNMPLDTAKSLCLADLTCTSFETFSPSEQLKFQFSTSCTADNHVLSTGYILYVLQC